MVFFGHVMRPDGLEKDIILACGEEERTAEEKVDGGDIGGTGLFGILLLPPLLPR